MITWIGLAAVAIVIGFQGRSLILAVKGEQLASDRAETDAINRRLELQRKTEGGILCLRRNTVRIP